MAAVQRELKLQGQEYQQLGVIPEGSLAGRPGQTGMTGPCRGLTGRVRRLSHTRHLTLPCPGPAGGGSGEREGGGDPVSFPDVSVWE